MTDQPAPTKKNRVLAWFSCGDASAVAAQLARQKHGDACKVLYCDTLAFEHIDNLRFLGDVERWLGVDIAILRSRDYRDIFDVFDRTGWLVGPAGARCTTELKKRVRMAYQEPDDIHVFGYTVDERHRVEQVRRENPELRWEFPLVDAGITKAECHERIRAAGIELPAMYQLGYRNNNCVGCVKGGAGYWNKIRVDFPEAFDRMARQERKMGVAICKTEPSLHGVRQRIPVFLDQLPPGAGRSEPEGDIECGVLCLSNDAAYLNNPEASR